MTYTKMNDNDNGLYWNEQLQLNEMILVKGITSATRKNFH